MQKTFYLFISPFIFKCSLESLNIWTICNPILDIIWAEKPKQAVNKLQTTVQPSFYTQYKQVHDLLSTCQLVTSCWVCCFQSCHAEKRQEWPDSAFGLERDAAGDRCHGNDPGVEPGGMGGSGCNTGETLENGSKGKKDSTQMIS